MIESDGVTLQLWKDGKSIFKVLILIWLITIPILFVAFQVVSMKLILIYVLVLIVFVLFQLFRKKIKLNLYSAKMNDEFIILTEDNNESIQLKWHEITSISRVRFTSPALYVLTAQKYNYKPFIFPTSAHLLTFSFTINGFGFYRDFSRMGKLIRKLKKQKNIKSFIYII